MDIGLLVFDGAEELDFVGPWEAFTMSNEVFTRDGRSAPDSVRLISVAPGPVHCAKGMRVLADATIAEIDKLDILLVPGGRGTRPLVKNDAVLKWVAAIAERAEWATSVCTGAFVLAAAGVSKGKTVTTHWRAIDEMRDYDWPVEIVSGARYIVDGRIVSAAGVSAGIDMALWLIGALHGPGHARATQKAMEYFPEPPYCEEGKSK